MEQKRKTDDRSVQLATPAVAVNYGKIGRRQSRGSNKYLGIVEEGADEANFSSLSVRRASFRGGNFRSLVETSQQHHPEDPIQRRYQLDKEANGGHQAFTKLYRTRYMVPSGPTNEYHEGIGRARYSVKERQMHRKQRPFPDNRPGARYVSQGTNQHCRIDENSVALSTNNNNKPSQQSYNLPELQYDKNNNVDGNIAFLNDSKTMEPTKSRPFTKVVRRQLPAVPPPPTILTKWPLIVGTKDFESKSFEYARQAPSRQVGQMLQKGVQIQSFEDSAYNAFIADHKTFPDIHAKTTCSTGKKAFGEPENIEKLASNNQMRGSHDTRSLFPPDIRPIRDREKRDVQSGQKLYSSAIALKQGDEEGVNVNDRRQDWLCQRCHQNERLALSADIPFRHSELPNQQGQKRREKLESIKRPCFVDINLTDVGDNRHEVGRRNKPSCDSKNMDDASEFFTNFTDFRKKPLNRSGGQSLLIECEDSSKARKNQFHRQDKKASRIGLGDLEWSYTQKYPSRNEQGIQHTKYTLSNHVEIGLSPALALPAIRKKLHTSECAYDEGVHHFEPLNPASPSFLGVERINYIPSHSIADQGQQFPNDTGADANDPFGASDSFRSSHSFRYIPASEIGGYPEDQHNENTDRPDAFVEDEERDHSADRSNERLLFFK